MPTLKIFVDPEELGFNSLQTGKDIVSLPRLAVCEWKKFQFPSNGKGHCKTGRVLHARPGLIGFQFPSNGKGHCKDVDCTPRSASKGFNSLQTGKDIVSDIINAYNGTELGVSIPFKRERTL